MTLTPEILEQLTELIGWAPPAEYLQLLENYPTALSELSREPDHPDCEETVAQVELLNDPLAILAINQEARHEALLEPDGGEFVWPDQLMIIGETGTGDYFCIDVTGEVQGVLQYNHQAVEFEIITDSLEEFVEWLQESFDGNLDDEDDFLDDSDDMDGIDADSE